MSKITITHNFNDGAHRGITDFYPEFKRELRRAVTGIAPFEASWSVKHECISARVARHLPNGDLTVCVRASMDDGPDLIDTLVWDAFGGNKFAGSGFDALVKHGRHEVEVDVIFDTLQDHLGELDLIYGINETGVEETLGREATYAEVVGKLDDLADAADKANKERYDGAVAFVRSYFGLDQKEAA